MYKYQIGLSYASEQKKKAERLYNLLKEKGVNVFFAEKESSEFIGKDLFTTLINIYKNECKYIIAIISDEYIQKDYTNQELSVALERNNNGERCLIPVYTTKKRYRKISDDYYYIDANQKTEYEIVNEIIKLLNNNSIKNLNDNLFPYSKLQKEATLLKIPRDYQIFISGATGVGKSTIARNLLNVIPEFVIIEEADMLREAVRGENDRIVQTISDYAATQGRRRAFSKEALRKLLKYDTLKKSTINLKYNEINEQCKLILAPLEKVCYRLMDKGMPAVIEGVNLSFEAMFENENSLYFTSLNSDNALFINFYLSNSAEHKERLLQRSDDRREDHQTRHRYLQKFSNIRSTNDNLSEKAAIYSQKYNNVFNIDTTGTIEDVLGKIIELIKSV